MLMLINGRLIGINDQTGDVYMNINARIIEDAYQERGLDGKWEQGIKSSAVS